MRFKTHRLVLVAIVWATLEWLFGDHLESIRQTHQQAASYYIIVDTMDKIRYGIINSRITLHYNDTLSQTGLPDALSIYFAFAKKKKNREEKSTPFDLYRMIFDSVSKRTDKGNYSFTQSSISFMLNGMTGWSAECIGFCIISESFFFCVFSFSWFSSHISENPHIYAYIIHMQ